MKRAKYRIAGFSLVEALVGILVVGILIVALYAMQASVCDKVQSSREDLRATQIAVKKLDQLRLFNWAQITNQLVVPSTFTEYFDPEDGISKNKNQTPQTFSYNGTITLTDGPSECTYGTDMRTVTVTLNWTSATGRARERAITTYIAKHGLQNYIY